MTKEILVKPVKDTKKRDLVLGFLFDAIGFISYAVPFLGELTDLVWAPIAGLILLKMYKGTVGKVGGVVTFLEEILPFSDFIPTFTLTWIYNYIIRDKNAS